MTDKQVVNRAFPRPDEDTSFFIFGPRGTGKSSMVQKMYPDALFLDLLSPSLELRFRTKPESIIEFINGHRNSVDKKSRNQFLRIIIDEVQKVPELLQVVHQQMELDSRLAFVLTGSNARKLKNAGADLLAGRALNLTLHPFLATELNETFNLGQAIQTGCLPLVYFKKRASTILKTYLSLYMRQELVQEGIIRNLASFARFLEAISFSHGEVLNVSAVASDCHVDRKTVDNYISILEDLLLGYRVPVFSKKAKRDLITHSKFYFFDAGVFHAIRPKGPLDAHARPESAALEGLIFQQINAWKAYFAEDCNIYFWRTSNQVEVDFVVYGEKLLAIEVKNSTRIRAEDLDGLKLFKADYPEAICLLLYRGVERLQIGDCHCLPCEDFLKLLKNNRWPDF